MSAENSTSGGNDRSRTDSPLVSIITVVRNGEKYIRDTIESVLNQSYPKIQYIIIDGASTDKTLAIIQSYKGIDKVISEPDRGIYYAMNKGIGLCEGELIGIINSDDYYFSNAVEKVVALYKLNSSDIIYGNMVIAGENKRDSIKQLIPDISLLDKQPSIFHPTCFVKRSIYTEIGLFDTRFKISSDYEFLLRAIRRGIRFEYLPEPITVFRIGGMSSSCASNIEGYKIMKIHNTGFHRQVIVRGLKCYFKQFLLGTMRWIKRIINNTGFI